MLTVHHLENSRSQRVLWLLEELGVPYEVKRYNRDPKTMLAPAELRAVHPLGKSPIIEHDGIIVAETGAIFQYILDTFDPEGRLSRAGNVAERRDVTYWLHYSEGSAMTPLLLKLVFSMLPERAPSLMKPLVKRVSGAAQDNFVDPRMMEQIDYCESALSQTGWFVGDRLSAADIMMSFPLEAAQNRVDLRSYSQIGDFVKRCQSKKTYQRALERGGPYAYA